MAASQESEAAKKKREAEQAKRKAEGLARLVELHQDFISRLPSLYPEDENPGLAERMAKAGRAYVAELKRK